MTPILQVSIEGDCSGLQRAVTNSHNALDSLNGRRAGVAVVMTGGASAVHGLDQVTAAVGRVPTTLTLGIDSSGIAEASGRMSTFGQQARQMGRDMDTLSGSRVLGFSDNGALQQIARDFGRATQASSTFGAQTESNLRRADAATQGFSRSTQAMNAEAAAAGRSTVMLGSSVGDVSEAATIGSRTMKAFEQDMATVGSTAERMTGQVKTAATVMNAAGGGGGVRGGGGGGVLRPGGGPGSGSGGGVGPPKPPEESGLMGNGFFKEGGSIDSGIGMLGMPAIIGGAIGVLEAVAPAAVGLMAMNQVVKDTPALSYAAGRAQHQMAMGIRDGSQGATAIGVPAYQKLGQALHGLGEEMGLVGKQNLGQTLGAETSLAGGATTALKALAPTIGPSVSAVENLGNAFLNGIANPEVAKGITATANALATPQVAQAVSDITTAVLVGSSYLAQGGIQAITSITGHGNGATNVGSGWKTQPVGETVAENSGGLFSYNPQDDLGIAADMPLPGGSAGVHLNQNTGFGRAADFAGSLLHTAGVASRDFMNGSMLSGSAAPELHAAGDDIGNRWNAMVSGQAPPGSAGGGGSATPQQLAASQAAAPHGWDQGPGGSLTPSSHWNQSDANQASLLYQQDHPNAPKPVTTTPTGGGAGGGGSSFGSLQPSQVQQLNSALGKTPAALSQTGAAAQTMSSGLQNVPQSAHQLSQGLQQVGQAASQMQAPLQQAAQHTSQASQAVTQMAQQAPQAVAQVAKIAPAVQTSLGQAATQIQSGGQAMGAQIPQSMGTGIDANQAAACAAANKLGTSAANCGAAALKAASPSKIFVGLGEGIGMGLEIGVVNSTPGAVAAVAAAMGKVVEGGQSGLQAASPSRTFQAMGAQAMAQAGAGAQGYAPGSNARYPQADNVAKAAEKARRDLAAANSPGAHADQAFDKQLRDMGYSDATRARLEDNRKAQQDRQKAAAARQQDSTKTAMARAFGSQDIDPSTGQLMSHNDRAALLKTQRDQQHADAMTAVKTGQTPGQVAANRQNAALTSGIDPGHKSEGFGDPNRGQNASGYEAGHAAGKANADGMKAGLDQNSQGPVSSAGKMAGEVIKKTNATLGIKSPSQEFHDVGDNCMRGWAEGVSGGRGHLDREWDNIDKDLNDRMGKWGMSPLGAGQPGSSSGGGGGGAGGGGGGGGGGGVQTPWDAHASSRWGPPPGGRGGGSVFNPVTATQAEWRAHIAKENAQIVQDSRAAYQSHLQAVAEGQAAAEAAFTPNVYGHNYRSVSGSIVNGVMQGFNKDGSVQYNPYVDALVGGFGSAVTTASNGVESIANSNGLQVGLVWGRSVLTGADSVITAANFTQISLPQIGSALAKTALGQLGLLGPAGSGAEITNVPAIALGTGSPASTAPPQVNATIVAQFGDQTIRAISQQVVDVSVGKIADLIPAQRG